MTEREPVARGNPPHRGDLRIVRESLDGHDRGIVPLVARLKCVPRFLAAINGRMGRLLLDEDLADLSQDALLVVWAKLKSFEGRAKLETWVYRICYLEFMNRMRSKGRHAKLSSVRIDAIVNTAEAPVRTSAVEYEQLEMGLRELGTPESDVIRLKHFEDRTFNEIGDVLVISPNTAKTYYYRGMASLRRRLMQSLEEAQS